MSAADLIRAYLASPKAGPLSEAARLGNLLAALRALGPLALLGGCRELRVACHRDVGDREGPLFQPDKLEAWLRRQRLARGVRFPAEEGSGARVAKVHLSGPRKGRDE